MKQKTRWSAQGLVAAAITVTLAVSPAQAAPVSSPAPTGADHHGVVLKPGQANMGWDTASPVTTFRAAAGRSQSTASNVNAVYGIDVSGWQGNVNWAGWWNSCTGYSGAFASTNPLWVANYGTSTPPLPAGRRFYTFHQYTASPLDKNKFNGPLDRLRALALG